MQIANRNIFPPNFNVLIVDDNPKNIQVLGNLLRDAGYKVEYTLDGKSAIELVQRESFDLILLDIMMPEMSGYEVCKAIKKIEEKSDVPIIFITAKTEIDSVTKGFEVGAVDYITKPFDSKELIYRVHNHIELQWRRKQLVKANSEKDRFYSIVAHDIKNPFTSILTAFDLLDVVFDELDKDKIKQRINKVKDDVEMVVNTSTNLLQWASAQSKMQKPDIVRFSLKEAIEEEITKQKHLISKKNIQVEVYISKDIYVLFDKTQLGIVISNLISNAVKFSVRGNKVEVSAKIADKTVELICKDYGIGMPAEVIEKLFEITEKATRLGTEKERGTGLGLLLIKKILIDNRGKISISSKRGLGTTVKLNILMG